MEPSMMLRDAEFGFVIGVSIAWTAALILLLPSFATYIILFVLSASMILGGLVRLALVLVERRRQK